MRYLLLVFALISTLCKGQEKVSAAADTIPKQLYGQVNVGASFPLGSFPQSNYGAHADINLKYFFIPRLAATIKVGYDVNGQGTSLNPLNNTFSYTFQQYLGGLCFRSKIHSELHKTRWFDVMALGGLCIAGSLPEVGVYGYNSSGIIANGESNSGKGYPFAYYIGGEFVIVTKHKKIISLGLGYLGAAVHYTNYAYNLTGLPNTPYAGQTATIKSPQTYSLADLQPYVGFGF